MRTSGVVDVVYVNIVTWSMGCERVGELAKGEAVVGRPGARVDGHSPPRAKKLVLQESKHGIVGSKGLGWMRHYMMCKCCNIWSVNDEISVFRLKNKLHVRCTNYTRLISWIRPRGSETRPIGNARQNHFHASPILLFPLCCTNTIGAATNIKKLVNFFYWRCKPGFANRRARVACFAYKRRIQLLIKYSANTIAQRRSDRFTYISRAHLLTEQCWPETKKRQI
jgi:hypothetical protein